MKGSTAVLTLRNNSYLILNTLSGEANSKEKETVLDLAIGSVLLKVNKLKGDSTFQVKTPNAVTGVRGTVFEVTAETR